MTSFTDTDNTIRVQAHNAPWRRGVVFLIRRGRNEAAELNFKPLPDGEVPPESFELRNEDAQELMDELWSAGLRPTEGSGSAGALSATQRHLEDMRTLVFNRHQSG